MAELCRNAPVPIALDEELINASPAELLPLVQPQGIVIKPSLHGGLLAAQKWAELAEEYGIRWWVNSALESSTGLTALSEWCAYAAPENELQGLGKGNLFTDDDGAQIELKDSQLWYKLIEKMNN